MMIISLNRALLGWWALIGLIVIVSEVVQHVPIRPGRFDFDFLRKILFFSRAFPLVLCLPGWPTLFYSRLMRRLP
jgi:hypothetical protein